MRECWNDIKIADISEITKSVGHYTQDSCHEYFTIIMKDGTKHTLHYYEARQCKKAQDEIRAIYNEFNNITESYLLENEMFIRVGGSTLPFGCRVENNLGNYEYKTLLEIDELRKQGKIRDEGWRHMVFICPLVIEQGKMVRGTLTEPFEKQLQAMGIEYNKN